MSINGGSPIGNYNLEAIFATERRRVMNSTTKTKEIMALSYANEKQRLNI